MSAPILCGTSRRLEHKMNQTNQINQTNETGHKDQPAMPGTAG